MGTAAPPKLNLLRATEVWPLHCAVCMAHCHVDMRWCHKPTDGFWQIVETSLQSLEFVAETRILAEMKIENCGKIYFPWKKWTSILFFYENEDDGSVKADIRHEL